MLKQMRPRPALIYSLVVLVILVVPIFNRSTSAQNSAPSSHLVFDDRFDGDILINEVRVPKEGESLYTYYEALGWRGKAAGYAGIQSHPRGRNFIFSIWDHKSHAKPIRPVYRGVGTVTQKFGGEGTGLKSWNFELGWKTDTWYTLVARCWKVDEHTFFGFWSRANDSGKWTHLVTMDVAVANARFQGGTDAFIEDWLSTGMKKREVHYRKGWKRDLKGKWNAFQSARYSVNSWDLDKGKRSFNFRTNWDGGVKKSGDDEFYYMQSGGKDTRPTCKNPATHEIKRKDKSPEFRKITIRNVEVVMASENIANLQWQIDSQDSPQFSYRVMVQKKDGPNPEAKNRIRSETVVRPHGRKHAMKISDFEGGETWIVTLICTDIFGNESKPVSVELK